ncbi:isochorismate synthase [Nocardia camponoti]|uniref:isochorismate synthase n=1 Tax=Nocardia camponoti TaxID=1616106 RepID=A0A917QJ35_9NOCA|nr:isochorismate synthase [Nocardia camponoti]GGK52918.1 isochorismate synthase [Nocardia camponoti]
MTYFLLAQPDSVLRATGMRTVFADAESAAAAGTLVVGALPFDMREPVALWEPEWSAHTAGPWQPAAVPALPAMRVVAELPSGASHVARVASLVDQLRDPGCALEKVVAARSMVVAADEPLEPEVVAAHLLTARPNAHVYAVDLAAAGQAGVFVLGATPEVLVTRRGNQVSLHPLAGTLPRLADPVADVAQSQELLNSKKNQAEHGYVIDWIRSRLTPLCSSLSIPDEPVLMQTESVWHLTTPITGTLADPAPTALDLAIALHPTPAVNGTPFAEAREAIVAEEQRGFYGGAVGWCDASGDGEWVVAIRGGELSADRRTLRATAGGGIVADSDPAVELAETTAKFATLLGALACPVPTDGPTC